MAEMGPKEQRLFDEVLRIEQKYGFLDSGSKTRRIEEIRVSLDEVVASEGGHETSAD